jgi:hypothetical protein
LFIVCLILIIFFIVIFFEEFNFFRNPFENSFFRNPFEHPFFQDPFFFFNYFPKNQRMENLFQKQFISSIEEVSSELYPSTPIIEHIVTLVEDEIDLTISDNDNDDDDEREDDDNDEKQDKDAYEYDFKTKSWIPIKKQKIEKENSSIQIEEISLIEFYRNYQDNPSTEICIISLVDDD